MALISNITSNITTRSSSFTHFRCLNTTRSRSRRSRRERWSAQSTPRSRATRFPRRAGTPPRGCSPPAASGSSIAGGGGHWWGRKRWMSRRSGSLGNDGGGEGSQGCGSGLQSRSHYHSCPQSLWWRRGRRRMKERRRRRPWRCRGRRRRESTDRVADLGDSIVGWITTTTRESYMNSEWRTQRQTQV